LPGASAATRTAGRPTRSQRTFAIASLGSKHGRRSAIQGKSEIRGDPALVATWATTHPALIPHEAAGSSRERAPIPATPGSESLLTAEIPAYPRSTRKRHDRPVTPEVAGSSPVAPVENILQMGIFCCRFWRNRPPAFQPVTRSSRTRIPDAVRSRKALQIAMFCRRTRGQSRRSSRADTASEWPVRPQRRPPRSLDLTVRVTGVDSEGAEECVGQGRVPMISAAQPASSRSACSECEPGSAV
jgi:hypothetical protein